MLKMNENILGVSCIHGRLSLTWMKNGKVRIAACENIPENIVSNGEIVSPNLFAVFLRDTVKKYEIGCKDVAWSIPLEDTFIRTIVLPQMADDQLKLNIPFEFSDFIQGELSEYSFAYVVQPKEKDYFAGGTGGAQDEGEDTMTLVACAVRKRYVNLIAKIAAGAKMRLVYAAPETVGYGRLLSLLPNEEEIRKERCFMDIGMGRTRMLIFKNRHYKLMQGVDIGERRVIQAIADDMNVDERLAQTYMENEFENCGERPAVVNVYKDISLEILKGINFYEVSDMTARLSDIVLCGGGARVRPLVELLKQRISMNVVTLEELLPDWDKFGELSNTGASLGLALAAADTDTRSVNLVELKEKAQGGRNWLQIAGASVAAVFCVAAFFKFAVYDRFHHVALLHQEEARLQAQIDAGKQEIMESGELAKSYHHYTWSEMTEEERELVGRSRVAQILKKVSGDGITVEGFSMTGNAATVRVQAGYLAQLSELAQRLEENKLVDTCSVQTAQSGRGSSTRVTAQLVVYLAGE